MASMIGGGSIGKLSKDIITNPIVKRAIAQFCKGVVFCNGMYIKSFFTTRFNFRIHILWICAIFLIYIV
jgi:hypothetical protein